MRECQKSATIAVTVSSPKEIVTVAVMKSERIHVTNLA